VPKVSANLVDSTQYNIVLLVYVFTHLSCIVIISKDNYCFVINFCIDLGKHW
jgi:hypothetical protein